MSLDHLGSRNITLRRAKIADAEALAALGYETFRETFIDGFAIPYPPEDLSVFVEATYTPAAYERRLADPGQVTWVAEGERGLVAYANAGPCVLPHPDARPADGELYRLYVAGAAQGLGLGRRLLETALDWMEAKGARPMWIGVWSGNLRAQRLYAAYGFEKVGDYHFNVGRWRDDEFILRRG